MARVKVNLGLLFYAGVMLVAIALGQACGQSQLAGTNLSSKAQTYETPNCQKPSGQSGAPQTVEEVVATINALPKPVSIPCFLETLDRPLKIYATTSPGSAQPTDDPSNPRVFISTGALIISVVPKGLVADRVEFSVIRPNLKSLKAELQFPISANIDQSLPYTSIRDTIGTSCRFCHKNEVIDSSISFAQAYTSDLVKPLSYGRVSLTSLRSHYLACDQVKEPNRCSMLRALVGVGSYVDFNF